MTKATVRDLRYDFPAVLSRVSKGESIAITKRGKIVAQLSPPAKSEARRLAYRKRFLARIWEMQRKAKSNNIVEWFLENRA